MKKFLVIGDPIEHSLSPKLHNYWFKQNNIDAVYEKKKINELELQDIVSKIRKNEIFGANVTVPYKSKIIKYLDLLSDDANATQSVNTILKKENKIFGFNTDVDGFEINSPFKSITLSAPNTNSSYMLELTLFAFNSARFLEIISGVAPSAIKLSLIGSSSTFD